MAILIHSQIWACNFKLISIVSLLMYQFVIFLSTLCFLLVDSIKKITYLQGILIIIKPTYFAFWSMSLLQYVNPAYFSLWSMSLLQYVYYMLNLFSLQNCMELQIVFFISCDLNTSSCFIQNIWESIQFQFPFLQHWVNKAWTILEQIVWVV